MVDERCKSRLPVVEPAVMSHKEVEKRLGGPNGNAELLARYIGARMPGEREPNEQSRLKFWGLSVPVHRQAARETYSFSQLNDEEQWSHWLKIWRGSDVFDVKNVAICWISSPKRRSLRLKHWRDLISMTAEIDNWAHSDALSAMLAELLEHRPALFSLYKKWNKSKNPWLRRQSLVGIYCYARLRKKHIPATKSLPLVKNLLCDPHFYVQRGVGWTLREIDRVNSNQQRAFVRRYLKDIGSIAWFATSELYPVSLRKELVARRKALRTKVNGST